VDQSVSELIDKEQRKHHAEHNKPRYIGVLCDKHQGVEMEPVELHHGHGPITEVQRGFRCPVPGCKRFFGKIGYADLTENNEFENILKGPGCPQFPALKMYLQKTSLGLIRWVCAQCNEERPSGPPIITYT
jgi:hypothetical protein